MANLATLHHTFNLHAIYGWANNLANITHSPFLSFLSRLGWGEKELWSRAQKIVRACLATPTTAFPNLHKTGVLVNLLSQNTLTAEPLQRIH